MQPYMGGQPDTPPSTTCWHVLLAVPRPRPTSAPQPTWTPSTTSHLTPPPHPLVEPLPVVCIQGKSSTTLDMHQGAILREVRVLSWRHGGEHGRRLGKAATHSVCISTGWPECPAVAPSPHPSIPDAHKIKSCNLLGALGCRHSPVVTVRGRTCIGMNLGQVCIRCDLGKATMPPPLISMRSLVNEARGMQRPTILSGGRLCESWLLRSRGRLAWRALCMV